MKVFCTWCDKLVKKSGLLRRDCSVICGDCVENSYEHI